MKKMILFLVLLSLTAPSYAQPADSIQPLTRADYLRKSKQQRTAAWLFSGAGLIGMLSAAGASMTNSLNSISFFGVTPEPRPEKEYYTGLYVAGGIAILAGIGFAFAAGSSKREANRRDVTLLPRMETAPTMAMSKQRYPALSLRLRLN